MTTDPVLDGRWRTPADSNQPLHVVLAEAMRISLCLRHEEARLVQIVDYTWTKLAYEVHLPCTGKGFPAASGAVSPGRGGQPVQQ